MAVGVTRSGVRVAMATGTKGVAVGLVAAGAPGREQPAARAASRSAKVVLRMKTEGVMASSAPAAGRVSGAQAL